MGDDGAPNECEVVREPLSVTATFRAGIFAPAWRIEVREEAAHV